MRDLLRKHLQGKKVIILLILSILAYVLMVVFTLPTLQSLAGGLELFDVRLTGYSPDYALQLLNALGTEGRYTYLTKQIPLDMIYSLLFAISYSLVTAYLLHKLTWFEGPAFYLVLLPLIGGLLDCCENFAVVAMLNQFPDLSTTTATFASYLTRSKFLFSIPALLSIILLLVIFLAKRTWTLIHKPSK